jgi:hypothetical protein
VSDTPGPDKPPTPPAGTRSGARAGSRRKPMAPAGPVWVLAASLATIAVLSGAGAWLALSGSLAAKDARIAELEKQVGSAKDVASVEPSGTPDAPSSSASKPQAPPASGAAAFAFIDDVTGSASKGYKVTVFYAKLLWGKAAADAAKSAGDEPPPPPPGDWYVVEGEGEPQTLPLAADAEITVLGWKGAAATTRTKITVAEFLKVMPGGSATQDAWVQGGYDVTATNGTVTKIEQVNLP